MKKKICVSFFSTLSLFLVFSFTTIKAREENIFPLLGKIIYIDPGHGGLDSGTVFKDIYEKDINLQICKKLQSSLEKKGAIVYLTRYGDYDLSIPNTTNKKKSDLNKRSEIINKSQADFFISIHLNSDISTIWKGPQIFYLDNEKNKVLAETFQTELNKQLNSDRKAKKESELYLLKNVKVPGFLLEVGFLSNPEDRLELVKDEYQQKIVNILSKLIITSFSKNNFN